MTTATGHTKAIRAGKAIGTNVYDRSGKSIGEVKDIVLDKTSNQHHVRGCELRRVPRHRREVYPIPWAELTTTRVKKATSFRSRRSN